MHDIAANMKENLLDFKPDQAFDFDFHFAKKIAAS